MANFNFLHMSLGNQDCFRISVCVCVCVSERERERERKRERERERERIGNRQSFIHFYNKDF